MPEMNLSIHLGLWAFIAVAIGVIALYHYWTDPPRKAPGDVRASDAPPKVAARTPKPSPTPAPSPRDETLPSRDEASGRR